MMIANKLCHSTEHEGSIFSAARGKKRGFIFRTEPTKYGISWRGSFYFRGNSWKHLQTVES